MNELVPVLTAAIERTGKIELPSSGISMYPLIKEGNISTFMSVRREDLKVGDICLFVTEHGLLTGHRLYAVKEDILQEWYIFKGDTCLVPDDPVPFSSIIGRWSGVRRNSRFVPANHWESKLLAALVKYVPKWYKVIRWCAERKQR
ncbi:MAG TPA: hypothetical protein VL921_21795 [Candidatus Udaeobacter sp.]|jgi:signal peptidase|nr:hypothetical protein [Candidatus Udaeobacter sp.]